MQNKWIRKAPLTVTGIALLLLIGNCAYAQSTAVYTLSNLIAGTTGTDGNGNILIGDKLFNRWSYSFIGPDMPSAANVQVQGVTVAGNFGIEFTGFWHANPGNGNESALINYRVTVTDPRFFITDVHLDGDPSVNGGNGQALVVESVSDTVNHSSVLPRTLSIFDIATNGGATETTRLNDALNTIGGYTSLDIEKTISASADSSTTTASITHIQQTFSQSVSSPEPASVAFLLGGVGIPVCLRGVRRRRPAVC